MAKKKYPLIVLEYLASRIRQKPVGGCTGGDGKSKKNVSSPLTQHSDTPIMYQQQEKKETENSLSTFFQACTFCDSKKSCSKMLDYDALVPVESNIAYPVFFKL